MCAYTHRTHESRRGQPVGKQPFAELCKGLLAAAVLMESGLSRTDPSIRKLPAASIKSSLGCST